MRVRWSAAVGLTVIGLLLTACSDDGGPATLPDVSPSTPATSPLATPTGDPTAQLEAEITAFYEDYVQTINESFASTDALARRSQMFVASCLHCQRGLALARRAHDEQLVLEGGELSTHAVSLDAVTDEIATFSVVSSAAAGGLIDGAGRVVQELAESTNLHVTYQARRQPAGRWILISSEVVS
ncbi:MAG: hypothetical protein ACRDWI_03570 [Jiangellaceae bacterium]